MKLVLCAVALMLLAPSKSYPQQTPAPENCLTTADGALLVSHEGKTYRLASEECRAQFVSDPERYAQLYDALLELQAEGAVISAPASLVPS